MNNFHFLKSFASSAFTLLSANTSTAGATGDAFSHDWFTII